MNPEARLANKILKELRSLGGFWFKVHGGPMQITGLPDIIGCYEGRFIGIEVKLPSTETHTSPRQRAILQRILDSGGVPYVATTPEAARNLVLSLRKASSHPSFGSRDY